MTALSFSSMYSILTLGGRYPGSACEQNVYNYMRVTSVIYPLRYEKQCVHL
jgi:hypothetical protein